MENIPGFEEFESAKIVVGIFERTIESGRARTVCRLDGNLSPLLKDFDTLCLSF